MPALHHVLVKSKTFDPLKLNIQEPLPSYCCQSPDEEKEKESLHIKNELEERNLQTIEDLAHLGCTSFLARNRGLAVKTLIIGLICTVIAIVYCFQSYLINTPDAENSSNPLIIWYTDVHWNVTLSTITCGDKGFTEVQCDLRDMRFRQAKANAYLFYGGNINFSQLPLPRDSRTIWGLMHDELPKHAVELMYEKALNLFNFSSTFSRYSNVPISMLPFDRDIDFMHSGAYFLNNIAKNEYLSEIAPVIYMESNCDTSTERDAYVAKLMQYIKIDSYGKCLNNRRLPLNNLTLLNKDDKYLSFFKDDEFKRFVARYKFMLIIEDGICNDYISDKFWWALQLGVVPIYFGAPTIYQYMPVTSAAILVTDFDSPEDLAAYLDTLLEFDSWYSIHLMHKFTQLPPNSILLTKHVHEDFKFKLLNLVKEFECLICQRLHDKANTEVNIVSKMHYDCNDNSAVTFNCNVKDTWIQKTKRAKALIKKIYNYSDNISN